MIRPADVEYLTRDSDNCNDTGSSAKAVHSGIFITIYQWRSREMRFAALHVVVDLSSPNLRRCLKIDNEDFKLVLEDISNSGAPRFQDLSGCSIASNLKQLHFRILVSRAFSFPIIDIAMRKVPQILPQWTASNETSGCSLVYYCFPLR